MRFIRLKLALLALMLVFAAIPTYAQDRKIDFTNLAIMGDSLSQSYHDGVLHSDAIQRNYSILFANQVNTELRQLDVPEPGGYGSRFFLRDPNGPLSFLNLTFPPQQQTIIRTNSAVRLNNLSVGGAKLTDIINARPDPDRMDTALYASLGLPWLFDDPPVRRSQLEFVETMDPKPTAVILFIGGNDALNAAGLSDLSLLTPVDQFQKDYEEVVRRTKATGAQMILVNVVDVTSAAFIIPAEDLPAVFRVVDDVFFQLTGLKKGDFVTLRAFPAIIDALGGKGALAENLVLRKKTAKQISATIAKYNKVISKIAKREKFPLVDVNGFLRDASKKGVDIPGVARVTTKYFGGLASFDGVHITYTANAILANLFIDTINKFYGTTFSKVDVAAVAKDDPEVPKSTTRQPAETLEQYIEARPQFEAIAERMTRMFKGEME
jgi:lysophospholipase L1-like esterase